MKSAPLLHVEQKVRPAAYISHEGAEASKGVSDTVDRGFCFGAKRAKQTIPNNQNPGVVFVNVDGIGAVVDAMMGWCIEHELEWPEAVDKFGVDEELVNEVNSVASQIDAEGHSARSQRHVEEPAKYAGEPGLAQCHGEIEVLALMMNHVGCPE